MMDTISLDDMLSNDVELMNYETYDGWYESPCTSPDQMFASVSAPSDEVTYTDCDVAGDWLLDGDKTTLTFSTDDMIDVIEWEDDQSLRKDNNVEKIVIPRPLKQSLDEKILRALHLFSEGSRGGILAQVWVPMKNGDNIVLSTREQPCLLDQTLSGYREVSQLFTFDVEAKPGSFPGLPGRVFTSKILEWTSNVMYYSEAEFLRVQYAIDHRVRGTIAVPVFEDEFTERSCSAVIELVTTEEKQNFDFEIMNICRALQAVDLSSTVPPRLYSQQSLSKNQKAALSEIKDVLQVICHTHRLPLALTWMPCSYMEDADHETARVHSKGKKNIDPSEKSILCIEETACYYSDIAMEGFVHACGGHFLEEGQGVVGKAMQLSRPVFIADVKEYDISEYPLVHHARKFGLNAAVAIRLRSSYTGDDDYILEFFLPVNMEGSVEQQLLLSSLSNTMLKICKSLRKVSDEELHGEYECKVEAELIVIDSLDSGDMVPQNVDALETIGTKDDGRSEQTILGLTRQTVKRRSTAEKHIDVSVLCQYFSGSLKDAAKSLGVCPTTLKRICRQNGISRWPSRKINKVNRSLRKIQSVLDSVEGVKGALKFDPDTGGLVASNAASSIDFESGKAFCFSTKQSDSVFQTAAKNELIDMKSALVESCDESKMVALDTGSSWPASLSTVPWTASPKASTISQSNVLFRRENTMIDREDEVIEYSQPSTSGTTDSSNGSGLMMNGSSTSSRSFEEKMPLRTEVDSGTKITVKATYGDEKIRFKFEPRVGCSQLYAEVGNRFRLQTDQFQLKYLDDEEEWVQLVTDSDLVECLDVLEILGTRTLKFIVLNRHNAQVQRFGSW